MCMLSNNIHDYHYISQGKTTIPNVDDGEELQLTDVRIIMKNEYVFLLIVLYVADVTALIMR